MTATIKDVARYANTSIATVSKVLNGKEMRVSEQKRQEILEAAKVLQYVTNAVGAQLKTGCTDMVAVIVGDLIYPFYAKMLKGIMECLRYYGKSVIVCDTDNSLELELEHLLKLRSGYVDGAIIMHSPSIRNSKNLENIENLLQTISLPIVFLNEMRFTGYSAVSVNAYDCGYIATEHMLKSGHRCIGYALEMKDSDGLCQKAEGYRAALKKYGRSFTEDLVADGCSRYSGGYDAYARLKDSGMTAVVCGNDQLALGLMAAAQRDGRRIPQDLSVIGMDNIYAGRISTPSLSTIDQSVEDTSEAVVDILLDEITFSKEKKPYMPKQVLLKPQLIIRRSTGTCTLVNEGRESDE